MMEPNVIHRRDGVQLSFDLPHRIYDACVYPRKPSNGSHVIICAHDEGVRIVWYAGRKLKQEKTQKVNGNSIDLTDDDSGQVFEYEDEPEEVDPANPFRKVLKYLDVTLGTTVIKVAVPPQSIASTDELSSTLASHAVVLAACADLSLRLLAIPLEPGIGEMREIEQLAITGMNSHQDLISAVALTLVPYAPEDTIRQGRSRSRSRSRDPGEAKGSSQDVKEWSLLLASTSITGSGMLLIHQIPINAHGQFSDLADDHLPIQRKYLRYPLAKCSLQFSPSLYPSSRHSSLLISSPDGTATKVYQTMPQMSSKKKRRGSAATTDSAASSSQHVRRNMLTDKVLIDLLPPFGRCGDQDLEPARKRVLDAKWILHGRAIIALLDDGEWGIWDVEAAGPSTSLSASNLVQPQRNASGVQGGSVTKFALKGNVGSRQTLKRMASNGKKPVAESSFAPMTPHTRKVRSQDFFQGQDQPTVNIEQSCHPRHGSIAVVVQPSNVTGPKIYDESIIFGYDSANILIPSIQSYWKSETTSKGSFDGSGLARPIVLPTIQTCGEEQRRVDILPNSAETANVDSFTTAKHAQNFLIATYSRLILFVSPLPEPSSNPQASSLPMRLLTESSTNQDQMLLDSGELDIDGMDRLLDNMAQSDTLSKSQSSGPLNGFGMKRVDFRSENEENDIEMETPSGHKGPKSRLTVSRTSNGQGGGRRLFT